MKFAIIYLVFLTSTHLLYAQEGEVINFDFTSTHFADRSFPAKVFLPEGTSIQTGLECNVPVVIYLHGSRSLYGVESDNLDAVYEESILPGMANAITIGTDDQGYEFTPMVIAAIQALNTSEPTYFNRHMWYDDPAGRNDGPFESLLKEFIDHVSDNYCDTRLVYGLGHSMGADALLRIGAKKDWFRGGAALSSAGANWQGIAFSRVRTDVSQNGAVPSIGQNFGQYAQNFDATRATFALWGVATALSPLQGNALETCQNNNIQAFAEIEAGVEGGLPVLPCAEFPFYMNGSTEIKTVYEEKWLPNLDLPYILENQLGEMFPLYFDWGAREQVTLLPSLNAELLKGLEELGYTAGVDFEYKLWEDGVNDQHDMTPARLTEALQFLNRVAKGAITIANESENIATRTIDFALYPNPTKGLVRIRMSHPPTGSVTIDTYDILGRQILRNTRILQGISEVKEISIDLHSLSKGMYLIRLTLPSGETRTRPLMIN